MKTFIDMTTGKQFTAQLCQQADNSYCWLVPLWVKSSPDKWEEVISK